MLYMAALAATVPAPLLSQPKESGGKTRFYNGFTKEERAQSAQL